MGRVCFFAFFPFFCDLLSFILFFPFSLVRVCEMVGGRCIVTAELVNFSGERQL